jgi:hypothetical protein
MSLKDYMIATDYWEQEMTLCEKHAHFWRECDYVHYVHERPNSGKLYPTTKPKCETCEADLIALHDEKC